MTVFWLLVAAVVLGGGWYVRARLFPWVDCPRCTKGRIYRWGGHRDCKRCRATGRVRRWGAKREERK